MFFNARLTLERKTSKTTKKKFIDMKIKNVEDHIKDSRVLNVTDFKKWNWNHILTSLKVKFKRGLSLILK